VAATPPFNADENGRRRRAVPWWGVLVLAIALVALVGLPGLLSGGRRPVASEGVSVSPPTIAGGPTANATSSPVAASTSPSPSSEGSTGSVIPSSAGLPTAGWPTIGHIYEIVLENHELSSIVGRSSAPYLNSLAAEFGLAANYTAVSHPSLPNYLALWSGSTQGVTNDAVHDFTTGQTLGDQILSSGRSWHVAAENVPTGCFTGATASGGEDGAGTYARKHEPAISWTSVSSSPDACGRITDFSHFDPTVGNFWFIAPNLCHDMHDCSVASGDAWLKGFLPRILDSAAFKADGLVLLTFDEGSSGAGGGGTVATIVISPKARPGFRSSTAHDHYSLLRTIETLWGMPCLEQSCSADTLREFFP
jgi:hypothetical protein